MKLILFILGVLLISSTITYAGSREQIARSVADRYGIGEFERIESIKFTFNAEVSGKTVKRTWKWNVRGNAVHYKTADSSGVWKSYSQDEITRLSEQIRTIDSLFINDKYWLLFPFQLVWDRDAEITAHKGRTNLPIGEGTGYKVTVRYPQQGGYTPGDIYELYLNQDNIIQQWVYRKGGSEEPTRISTWEDNKRVGPLLISFDHRGPDDDFRVWFTDVAVKLKGSDKWIR